MDDQVTVSVTLPRDVVEGIKRIAGANNTTLATAITESVQINEVLTDAERKRAKILLQAPDGRMTELVRHR